MIQIASQKKSTTLQARPWLPNISTGVWSTFHNTWTFSVRSAIANRTIKLNRLRDFFFFFYIFRTVHRAVCVCIYIYICVCVCVKDQQDAHFITFICFNYTILYMFRTNKCIIRKLLLYTRIQYFSYMYMMSSR